MLKVVDEKDWIKGGCVTVASLKILILLFVVSIGLSKEKM